MAGHDYDERILNGEEWTVEALAVIHDVKDHVLEIVIADRSVNNDQLIHMNLTTKEKQRYCIELTAQGFRVVGYDYNRTDVSSDDYFETPYALLDKLSPLYRQAFGDSLVSKLLLLHSSRRHSMDNEPQLDD
ncbi:GSK3-beta interaction protein-like [Daphnia pulex]|uniref:GSK3-beta interaction protein-like n=1 Tax=Daphnia pulex TaxID=6669 RepID=UPI001EE0D884|nr:GSK3-beta interaction protein-like [Daphnia pulex]